MRPLLFLLFATLSAQFTAQAHPVTYTHDRERIRDQEHTQLVPRQLSAVKDIGRGSYKAVGLFEDKRVIAGTVGAALLGLVGISIAGMRATEHHACEKVAEQERVMQQSWDAMHPDGFVGAGDQMRPASFDCKVQERPMKPLISYGNPSQWY